MRVRLLQSFLVVSTLSAAGTASAHFDLIAPPSNNNSDNGGKGAPPCGPDVLSVVTPVMGGSMLELKVDETVVHPGHYRVALALKSRDEIDPSKPGGLKEPEVKNMGGTVIMEGISATAAIQNPPIFPVIADNVLPHTEGGGMKTAMIPIPNVNCDKCTLQVIEFMAKHEEPFFYRHCADLKITADPGKPIFDPTGMGGSGMGGSGGSGGGGGSGGAGGSAGSVTAGATSGGAPAAGGAPGAAGTATAGTAMAGTGTAGTGVSPLAGAGAEDAGSCSIARVATRDRGPFTLLAGSLLLGLGWLARRRNRPE